MVSDDDLKPIVEEFKLKLFHYKKSLKEDEEIPNDAYYRLYAEVLADWGVMCPHPDDFRRYGASNDRSATKENSPYYVCGMCSCIVLNQDWMKNAQREKTREDDRGPEQGRAGSS